MITPVPEESWRSFLETTILQKFPGSCTGPGFTGDQIAPIMDEEDIVRIFMESSGIEDRENIQIKSEEDDPEVFFITSEHSPCILRFHQQKELGYTEINRFTHTA